jgi:four helix bundle protein
MRHNFKELNSWKISFELVKEVYILCKDLPGEEKFGLKSQIQRSAVSIPSNIAEGSGRTTNRDFILFLNYAISSAFELETQLLLVNEIFGLDVADLILKLQNVQKLIGGLIRKLINS